MVNVKMYRLANVYVDFYFRDMMFKLPLSCLNVNVQMLMEWLPYRYVSKQGKQKAIIFCL